MLPGVILAELVENDRIAGGISDASKEVAVDVYRSFVSDEVLATDSRAAQMVKLPGNFFRDVNIAFAYELSLICDKKGIDVWELTALASGFILAKTGPAR